MTENVWNGNELNHEVIEKLKTQAEEKRVKHNEAYQEFIKAHDSNTIPSDMDDGEEEKEVLFSKEQ